MMMFPRGERFLIIITRNLIKKVIEATLDFIVFIYIFIEITILNLLIYQKILLKTPLANFMHTLYLGFQLL